MVFEVLTMKMAGRVAFGEKVRFLLRQGEGRIMGVAIGGRKSTKSALSSVCVSRGARGERGRAEREVQ